jgi:hypothetical protein
VDERAMVASLKLPVYEALSYATVVRGLKLPARRTWTSGRWWRKRLKSSPRTPPIGTHFTCFPSTKGQILTETEAEKLAADAADRYSLYWLY